MVPVYRGGDEFLACLESIRAAPKLFAHFYLSFNGPEAGQDEQMARKALQGAESNVTFIRTPRTLDFIHHFAFYVDHMAKAGVHDDSWVLMLQHDDWLNISNIRMCTQDGDGWDLRPGSLYLGPWDVFWEPTVQALGGVENTDPELISALYDIERSDMPQGDWIARELLDPYYINTTGAIAQFRHWSAVAHARPPKPGGMRFEMTLACSPGIRFIRQFDRPIVSVMARPDSEREKYSSLAKRKDDAHFVFWAARNWLRSPKSALPTIRAVPKILGRSARHAVTRQKPGN
jgi:hypothetical protein